MDLQPKPQPSIAAAAAPPPEPTRSQLHRIAAAFAVQGRIEAITPLGSGNVNATYLVQTDHCRYVLQRLNSQVFQRPDLVMRNLQVLTAHVEARLGVGPQWLDGRRWELPRVVLDRAGAEAWHRCAGGGFWRMLTYVGATRSVDVIEHRQQARELGWGLGVFHQLISDLPVDRLTDTLEGFHITPRYLQAYHQALVRTQQPSSTLARECLAFIRDREAGAAILETARARNELHLRPIHGDPKINNMLLDADSGAAVALIDLDTVKPGLLHYDIGDCLRSCCNPCGEECLDFDSVYFDLDLAAAILEGYLQVAGSLLSAVELDYITDAVRLISFELGLRFFTDHLAGNAYFKVSHPDQNLHRAVVQFRLAASIEAQASELRQLVCRLAAAHASSRTD